MYLDCTIKIPEVDGKIMSTLHYFTPNPDKPEKYLLNLNVML